MLIDNTSLSSKAVADRVIDWLGLTRLERT
jgi:hypothetical protein